VVLVSSFIPFPNICWWALAAKTGTVCFDAAEHFEKMSYRNKYFISGANGGIQLSIPLEQGREQRTAMKDIKIYNKERWQTRHWRTIVSVYKRTPYFEHYEPDLQKLFEQPFESLIDFNLASVHWLQQQLKVSFEEVVLDAYEKHYADAIDIRTGFKPWIEKQALDIEPYYQVFSDRNGFLPNLSMLDLLFSEGPATMQWIKKRDELIEKWRKK
jgi:hypothetical protein